MRIRVPLRLIAPVVLFSLVAPMAACEAAARQPEPATPAAVAPWPPPSALPEGTVRADGPLTVVTTTSLLADFVRQIGGIRVEARSLLPANADPHDYEPTPDDLVRIEEADAVFEHGLNLDAWADDLVDESGTDAPVFVATRDVVTLPSEEAGFTAGDPHVWFDPSRTATMVANIAADLTTLDPDGGATYEARRATYQTDLDALDAAITERVATIPPARRKLVTNHDALAYYADRYGLTVVGSIIPSLDSRAEPSARETAELVDLIESEGVPAIFTESSLNPELARELAAQANIIIVDNLYTDSLGPEASGADSYLGLMRSDTDLIVAALR